MIRVEFLNDSYRLLKEVDVDLSYNSGNREKVYINILNGVISQPDGWHHYILSERKNNEHNR